MEIREIIGQRRFTVLLGKNGAGKSTLLRSIDQCQLHTRYITPERGGELTYEPGVDHNMNQTPDWLANTRRRNRLDNFRQQSTAQFRNLELLYLREIEKDHAKRADVDHTFDKVISQLNEFLPAIKLVRSDRGFSIENSVGEQIAAAEISSGESEFIAQAIEVLVYAHSSEEDKILLLDEPDVHLHPDLQSRFTKFIQKIAEDRDIKVVIATHSTAILSGFSDIADLQIVPVVSRDQRNFESYSRESVSDALLPIFGAHPLSTIFNQSPIVLVEGEDDCRVVEQVVRSSNGRIRLKPCVVGTVDQMGRWENWLETFLPVLYDDPAAFSVRDLDDAVDCDINDLPIVKRSRLNCYSIENLLLTDESLAVSGVDSDQLLDALLQWQASYPAHAHFTAVQYLVDNFDSRRKINIKDIRNIVVALLGVTKPWEVYVGQMLAGQQWYGGQGPNSLTNYLGPKAAALFGRPA